MPEGDTVHFAARRLHGALAGAPIIRSEFRVPRFALVDLAGDVVREVAARGKHLLLRTVGGTTVHTHFAMEGEWHVYRPGDRWRRPGHEARVVLKTESRHAVGFRLAIVEVLATSEEQRVVGHLGPDPLADDWDAEEAVRRLHAAADTPVAEALLDQRIVAGFGNVYKSEICFLRGLDPWMPVADVTDLAALVGLGARLIQANRHTAAHVTTGDMRPGRKRYVYGRAGRPCLRCGTPIKRAEQPSYGSDRITYWCPSCQPAR